MGWAGRVDELEAKRVCLEQGRLRVLPAEERTGEGGREGGREKDGIVWKTRDSRMGEVVGEVILYI